MTVVKKSLFSCLQALFLWLSKDPYERFKMALDAPQATQDDVLNCILQNFRRSHYGRHLGEIQTYEEFAKNVPLIEYDDISELIERTMEGERDLLLPGKVQLFEKTSGSSSRVKYIPYPKGVLKDFTLMFQIWVTNLLKEGPKLSTGTFYFSVSPQFSGKKEEGKTKLNLEDDRDYLSGWSRFLIAPFMAVSPKIKNITDPESFQRSLLESLLQKKDLEVISVWNPSFLTTLLKRLGDDSPEDLTPYFPSLKMISCWGSALAEKDYQILARRFPNVYVQKKGLLATEAPLTIPFIEGSKEVFAPLLNRVFFEFRDPESGDIFRLHDIQRGREYEVIISTRGGLYRYRLGDRVFVTDIYKQTPCFDFIGKAGETSDLVGEKLTESFCESVFQDDENQGLYFLVPSLESKRYYLVSEKQGMAERLENELQQSYHYQNARKLGQLAPVREIQVENLEEKLLHFFTEARGLKRGDIKFRHLYAHEWNDELLNYLAQ